MAQDRGAPAQEPSSAPAPGPDDEAGPSAQAPGPASTGAPTAATAAEPAPEAGGVSPAEPAPDPGASPTAAQAGSSEAAPDPKNPEPFPQGPHPGGVEDPRPVPDYDGRADPSATAGEVLLWVPRVAFFPLYLVSEYVIRVPLGALVTTAERDNWLAVLTDFFTFDEEQKIGMVPTAYIEFDFQPSVGLYFFADDAFVDGNQIRIHGALWPDDWWKLTVVDRLTSSDETRRLSLRGNLLIRPDYQFFGLGPDTREDDEARFASRTYEAALQFDGRPWRSSSVHWETGPRKRSFSTDTDFEAPNLQQAIDDPDNGIDRLPPGFDEGYSAWRNVLAVAVDTRQPFPAPGHGVRLEVHGEHAFDLEEPVDRRWVKYGGSLGGYLDILNQRVVSLELAVDFADPIEGEVPFTELATLGGQPPMQGFQEGRLFDRSFAAATFEYRWPVWIWLDFAFHYSLGNVFSEHLSNFETDRLRSSFGFGLRTARTGQPDHYLNFLLAFGTETIDQGHGIDTIRFAIGGLSGF